MKYPKFRQISTGEVEIIIHNIPCFNCLQFSLELLEYGFGSRGGCIVSPNKPQLYCKLCDFSFMNQEESMEVIDLVRAMKSQGRDNFLMENYLLPVNKPLSKFIKKVAIFLIEDRKNLLMLRLSEDPEFQHIIKRKLDLLVNSSS